jgi:hypothetical protein
MRQLAINILPEVTGSSTVVFELALEKEISK